MQWGGGPDGQVLGVTDDMTAATAGKEVRLTESLGQKFCS